MEDDRCAGDREMINDRLQRLQADVTTAQPAHEAAAFLAGGHEWGAGWERRPGWTYRAPFGASGPNKDLPAVHVSWTEASEFCIWAGGRLPTREEWVEAAYKEQRVEPADDLKEGEIYPYPTGADGHGANTSDEDPWPQLAPAATTKAGVNGLFDMGGNAWEWLADRDGDSALTAGGSWWYGRDKMKAASMLWKPAEFYAVYVGFRCVYDYTLRRTSLN
ncbi:formylglycine-generating enzyme family protein [Agrobacterium burrii]